MPFVTKSDLQFTYTWTAAKEYDNPVETCFPDTVDFARQEGYEVLHYLNRIVELSGWNSRAHALKVERMLQDLPDNISKYSKVHKWVIDNWEKYS